jgi:glycine betaine/proline transport system substrate-binding protein
MFALVLAACNGDDDADDVPVDTDDTAVVDDTADDADVADDADTDVADDTDAEVVIGGSDIDEPITFADYGWDSALVLNRVAQFILEEGYGYETDAVPGETIALWEAIMRGDVEISLEIWAEQQAGWAPALEEGTVVDHGTSFGESVQGWWVPTYVIEGDEERGIEPMAPDLRSVDDLPDYVELFQDPEQPDMGRFYNCIAGWECQRVNDAKFKYYGLDEHFTMFDPGSDAALSTSLVSAVERGDPWLGYYWGPTWIFGLVDLTMIEEPEYTEECWNEVMRAAEAEDTPDQACEYPAVAVHVASRADFIENAPDIHEFLDNFGMEMDDVSEMLLYMYEEDVDDHAVAAEWFLREREDLWTNWVPEEVAERVREALN